MAHGEAGEKAGEADGDKNDAIDKSEALSGHDAVSEEGGRDLAANTARCPTAMAKKVPARGLP